MAHAFTSSRTLHRGTRFPKLVTILGCIPQLVNRFEKKNLLNEKMKMLNKYLVHLNLHAGALNTENIYSITKLNKKILRIPFCSF